MKKTYNLNVTGNKIPKYWTLSGFVDVDQQFPVKPQTFRFIRRPPSKGAETLSGGE